MANVPTDEPETVYVEISPNAIRDALLAVIPDDHDIVRDIRLHDGIADIMIRWRTLRWSTNMAYQNLSPKEIALIVDRDFRKWLLNIVNNMNKTPKFSRVINEMRAWLRTNPDKAAWLNQEPANAG